MNQIACAACRHHIDEAAKICPYCGSDPHTGQKIVDSGALLQEIFKPRQLTTGETVLEFARHRQGVVIAVSALILFALLVGLHQFVTARNQREVSAAPAVPLTEVTDVSNQQDETKPQAMPDLPFQYQGRPEAMRTYIMEQGAVTPPEVVAAQQAAAQAAAAKQQAATAKQPGAAPQAQPQPPAPQQPAPAVQPQPHR